MTLNKRKKKEKSTTGINLVCIAFLGGCFIAMHSQKEINKQYYSPKSEYSLPSENSKLIEYQEPLTAKLNPKKIECLAKNIFFEARGESFNEKIRVANVTMNRRNSEKFPSNVCEVVYQYKQFSWTWQLKNHSVSQYIKTEADLQAWQDSQEVAKLALVNQLPDLTKGAMFYHNHKVKPNWAKRMIMTINSEAHKYFKNK